MQNASQGHVSHVGKIVIGLLLVAIIGFLVISASAAPATGATPAVVEAPSFLDRLRAKLPNNPFGLDEEERLEIVKEYNAETARQGQAMRVANATAQRNAAIAADNKKKYEGSLRALRMCIATASNQ